MKTPCILVLLSVSACNTGVAPEVQWKDSIPIAIENPPAPVVAAHASEPNLPAPTPLLATEGDASAPKPVVEANGCLTGMRDLGACCAPQLKPGGCDCREGKLCARSCEYDSNHVANVETFCQDGGI